MPKEVFINLPVKDLKRSMEFFSKVGFEFNQKMSSETSACMVIGENSYAMLQTESDFQDFTKKTLPDAKKSAEVFVCVTANSRNEVDQLVSKAVAAGATAPKQARIEGSLYGHIFEDLDGHIWDMIYIQPEEKTKTGR
ncbi:MAG: glyoxalase/bleomycin resistance/extradiol dioxygenase family protein [Bdellovibrio sp.]|nr:glyoxalase/bleomycin resistance/extradiol dioxygenase family protein [Bdellovibrio sp.]